MGYTHYWYRPKEIPAEVFEKIVVDFKMISIKIDRRVELREYDGRGYPTIEKNEVRFNGNIRSDNSCESFNFPQIIEAGEPESRDGKYFDFCNTEMKPYDLAVCVFLIIAKYYIGKELVVSSDGRFDNEWLPAFKIIAEHLDYSDYKTKEGFELND